MLVKLSNPAVCGKMQVLMDLMRVWKQDGSKVRPVFRRCIQGQCTVTSTGRSIRDASADDHTTDRLFENLHV